MRSAKVIKSSIWQLIYQISIMMLGFFAPRFIILTYGSEINGLQSTITQMLNILALMNAGAITASVYELYKPFAEDDRESISKTLSNSIKYFKYVGIAFFIIMSVLAFVVSNTLDYSLKRYEIIVAFLILGIKSTIDIVFTSKFRIVFSADQKQHLTSIGMLIEQFVYYVLLFTVLICKQYFLLMYTSLLFGCGIKQIYFIHYFNKYYSYLNIDNNVKYKRPASANYAMINEISHTFITGTISIIISYTHGLSNASIYSVYALINTALIVFSNVLLNSFTPSFGNLLASGDRQGASKVFRTFHCLFAFMNTILYSCSAFLIMPFVNLYTRGTSDVNYIHPLLGILICLYGLVYTYRIPFNILVSTNGLFKETWKQPLISAIISFVISVTFSSIDFSLVLLGPISFYATNFLYQYYYVKKNKIEEGIDCVVKENGISLIFVNSVLLIGHLVNFSMNSFGIWILVACAFFIICIVCVIILFLVFDKKSFIMTKNYVIKAISSRIRKV